MKILHLNHSDSVGGAARFTVRLHEALLALNQDSRICCSSRKTTAPEIFRINPEFSALTSMFRSKIPQYLDSQIRKFDSSQIPQFKSPGLIGGVSAKWINNSDYDVVHLHWVNGGLISIREIGKIKKPIIWSMLDMWPFTGAEHYVDKVDGRWIQGYSNQLLQVSWKGIDVSGISGALKQKSWRENMKFVSPSIWLAEQARESRILRNYEVDVIPPALNTRIFSHTKEATDLNTSRKFTVGYGGAVSTRKGWKLFQEFLKTNCPDLSDLRIVIFGTPISPEFESPYYELKQMDRISKETELVKIYNELDVLIFPSLIETYGLIAQEAQSCGVPVICLKGTGAVEVIEDRETGFAIENNISDLLAKLVLMKNDSKLRSEMKIKARNRAVENWSYNKIGKRYIEIYKEQISQSCKP